MAKIKKAQAGTALDSYKKASKKSAVNAKADAAYTKSSFKTADSLRSAFPKVDPKGGLTKFLEERKANKAKADSIEGAVEKRIGVPRKLNMYSQKNGGVTKKAQAGKKVKGFGDHTDKMAKALDKASVLGKNYIAPSDSTKKSRPMGMNFDKKSFDKVPSFDKLNKKAVSKKKNGGTVSSQLGSYKGVIGKNTKGKATKAVGLTKAMYGKSMMKSGGKKMMMGGGKCKYGC